MTPRIPTGWRRVRTGREVYNGDMWYEGRGWATLKKQGSYLWPVMRCEIIIRRKTKKGRK